MRSKSGAARLGPICGIEHRDLNAASKLVHGSVRTFSLALAKLPRLPHGACTVVVLFRLERHLPKMKQEGFERDVPTQGPVMAFPIGVTSTLTSRWRGLDRREAALGGGKDDGTSCPNHGSQPGNRCGNRIGTG